MRKIGLSLLAIISVATIYYFTSGASQLTLQMKEQVDAQIATLQTKGFSISAKEIEENKEHFIITVEDPKKVAKLLMDKGIQATTQDIESLKGLKLGVDIEYLANAYSAASLDIYPLALPTALSSTNLSGDDKKVFQKIEKMLEKKTFLIHIDINKMGNGFKGYMKDIDEVFEGEKEVKFSMNALKFTGDIKDDELKSIKQTLENINIYIEDEALDMTMSNLTSDYISTGATPYDYTTDYTIKDIVISAKDEFKMVLKNFLVHSNSKVTGELISVSAETKIDKMQFKEGQNETTLNTLLFDMQAKNLDLQALSKLETIDPNNEKELLAVAQQIISKGMQLNISDFSIKHIEHNKKKLEGFSLTSTFDIDKSLDLASLEQNPMAAIGAIDANLKLTLSNQLFGLIAQQPQAVMAMMLFQPKDVNGDKVYTLELKDGTLKVNDKPVM